MYVCIYVVAHEYIIVSISEEIIQQYQYDHTSQGQWYSIDVIRILPRNDRPSGDININLQSSSNSTNE